MAHANTPLYINHPGTVSVAGTTAPMVGAKCIARLVENNTPAIDIVSLGNNAGQQAAKVMAAARSLILERKLASEVAFIPLWFMLEVNGSNERKTAIIWRLFSLK